MLCNGKIISCGDNKCGQLGHGDLTNRTVFVEIKDTPQNIVDIVGGLFHTVILLNDGRIMTCGDNSSGQLGLGDTRDRWKFTEVKIPGNVSEIICGKYCTMIRLTNGTVMNCGHNRYGQLGHGDVRNRAVFEEIKGIPGTISEIYCGCKHTVIKLGDGRMMSCGSNNYGQLGHGDQKDRTIFEEIYNC